MSTILELSKIRYSVRKYLPKPVEEEKLALILEAGRLAPTAVNYQPQRIFVLKSDEAIAKMRGVTRMAYNAPVILLVCYDENESWKSTPATFGDSYDGGEQDACIVTSMMMMQATELGLGTLWVRGYRTQDIVDAFELPENIKPVCLLLVGYADESKPVRRTGRKDIGETVREL